MRFAYNLNSGVWLCCHAFIAFPLQLSFPTELETPRCLCSALYGENFTVWLPGWKGFSSLSASVLREKHTKASLLLLLPVEKPGEQSEWGSKDWGKCGTGCFLPSLTLASALTSSLSPVSSHVKGLCLSKVRQRNPEACAVGCCLNYLFGLCYLGLMTLLVKNTIKWLIGRCAAGAQAMLISHFILFINMVQNWGKSQPTLKCLCFLHLALHF